MSEGTIWINGRRYAPEDALRLSDLEREVRSREQDLQRAYRRRLKREVVQAADLLEIARDKLSAALDGCALPQGQE